MRASAAAQPPLPALTAPVNDFAGIIDPQSEAELDRRIRALQSATGDVIVVATVPSYEGFQDIRELAVRSGQVGDSRGGTQRPFVRRPTSMKRRTLPTLSIGVPERFQNSMRLPVPVWTFTMMSLTTLRSRGCGTFSQPLYSV